MSVSSYCILIKFLLEKKYIVKHIHCIHTLWLNTFFKNMFMLPIEALWHLYITLKTDLSLKKKLGQRAISNSFMTSALLQWKIVYLIFLYFCDCLENLSHLIFNGYRLTSLKDRIKWYLNMHMGRINVEGYSYKKWSFFF